MSHLWVINLSGIVSDGQQPRTSQHPPHQSLLHHDPAARTQLVERQLQHALQSLPTSIHHRARGQSRRPGGSHQQGLIEKNI